MFPSSEVYCFVHKTKDIILGFFFTYSGTFKRKMQAVTVIYSIFFLCPYIYILIREYKFKYCGMSWEKPSYLNSGVNAFCTVRDNKSEYVKNFQIYYGALYNVKKI